MRISIDELRQALLAYLGRLGLDERDAATLAELVVEQEMVGNVFSAVGHLTESMERLANGARSREEVEVERPAMRLLRGHGRPAPLILADHLDAAVERARAQGIYAVGIHDSTYLDYFEIYCRRVAAQDCIALLLGNGGPQGVVPYGGTRDVTGTNPLAYGIPTHGDPIVFDAATATHAYRLIAQARERGERLPAGYVDRDGRETADPHEAVAILAFGGFKGYAVNLLVDVLTGALVRAKSGLDMPLDAERHIGTLLVVIDPAAFGDLEVFKDSTTKLMNDLLAVPAADPAHPVRVPGLRGAEQYRRSIEDGAVELEDRVWWGLLAATRRD